MSGGGKGGGCLRSAPKTQRRFSLSLLRMKKYYTRRPRGIKEQIIKLIFGREDPFFRRQHDPPLRCALPQPPDGSVDQRQQRKRLLVRPRFPRHRERPRAFTPLRPRRVRGGRRHAGSRGGHGQHGYRGRCESRQHADFHRNRHACSAFRVED